jgi:hypothetical protein
LKKQSINVNVVGMNGSREKIILNHVLRVSRIGGERKREKNKNYLDNCSIRRTVSLKYPAISIVE